MLKIIAIVVAVLVSGAGIFVAVEVHAFNASMSKVYEIPLPAVADATDAETLARGKHLAESLGACMECHGADLSGGRALEFGPLGHFVTPNLTRGKNGVDYSGAELVRLLQHGVKRDGTSVRFMPAHEMAWWPQADAEAVASYVHALPPKDGVPAEVHVGVLAKVLDRFDLSDFDIARRIDHAPKPSVQSPAPTKEYGANLARLCKGCHGERLSGGKLPGAPPEIPIPLNITPDASGLQAWSYEDFAHFLDTGVRKNGKTLNPFMPLTSFRNMSDTERHALWAYLQSVPAVPFGNR